MTSRFINNLSKTLLRLKQIVPKIICLLSTLYIYCIRFLLGRPFVLARMSVYARWVGAEKVLSILGATVGPYARIASDICIQNASKGRCANLHIGELVYIGPGCLFDLASSITIENAAAISARVNFVTHADVGDRPLRERFPREEGPVTVCRGAWVGINTTVLHGVTIGEYAVVGAMSLVDKNVPANCLAFGIPCKVVKQFDDLT